MPVREGAQPYDVMRRIAGLVQGDVLLFDADAFRGEENSREHAQLRTPLTHYFGLHVFPYHGAGTLADLLQSFQGGVGTNRLWLLTANADVRPGLELYETFDYHDRRMHGSPTIPVTINERYGARTLFLYRQTPALRRARLRFPTAHGRPHHTLNDPAPFLARPASPHLRNAEPFPFAAPVAPTRPPDNHRPLNRSRS